LVIDHALALCYNPAVRWLRRNIKQPLYISADGERGQVILRRIQRHVPYC
jgi:hypothetical protein